MPFYFLHHKFMDRRLVLHHMIFFFPYWELSLFHLKEALYGFFLAYPKCHNHHQSCILGSTLDKTMVLEHKSCETTTVALITMCLLSGWWDLLNQGMIHIQGGMKWGGLKFHHTCRMAHSLKLELFVSGIFIYYFWTSLGCSLQELQKRKQSLSGDYRNGNRG